MSLRSVAEAIFNAIVTWGYWVIGLIAVAAFVAPLFAPATQGDPTAVGSGAYAPVCEPATQGGRNGEAGEYTPVCKPVTQEDPTGGAGISAPIIALCTAAVLLSQALGSGGMRLRPTPSIFVGIGSAASAYMWIAAEARVHPFDPQLPLILGILLLLAAIATIAVPFLALSVRQQPSNQDPEEHNQEETPNE